MKKSIWVILMYILPTSIYSQSEIDGITIVTKNKLQYEKIEFEFDVIANYENPYDADQITVDMVIKAPSGKNLILPCFFDSVLSNRKWHARFTPEEYGTYEYYLQLKLNNQVVYNSSSDNFYVKRTAKDGFIRKRDNWTFQYSSGRAFRGIGENICWEYRSWENSKYTYKYFLPKIANNGGNFIRIWLAPWNFPLEYQKVQSTTIYKNAPTNSYFHPQGITKLDEMVNLCDSLGLHLMIVLDAHGAIQGDEWTISPYNAANGGPCINRKDFFTNSLAKKRYKNRLRYLVARWGYSPAIGVWELFNEVDHLVRSDLVKASIDDIVSWHTEMSNYLKIIDPYKHLVSTSVSHEYMTNFVSIPDMDFNMHHIYKNTIAIPQQIKYYSGLSGKPYVIGEYAYEWDWNVDFATIKNELIHDYKLGLWLGLFTPTPILPLSWWWEWFDQNETYKYIAKIRKIYDLMNESGNGSYQNITTVFPYVDYGVRCGNDIYVFVYNNTTTPFSDKILSINTQDTLEYEVERYDPESDEFYKEGNYKSISGTLSLQNINLEVNEFGIFILRPFGNAKCYRKPFMDIIKNIPGKIEAEDFDEGCNNISFNECDSINTFGYYRNDCGVDIDTINGGYEVSDILNGEWLSYSVNVSKGGEYIVKARMKVDSGAYSQVFLNNTSEGFFLAPQDKHDFDTLEIKVPLVSKGDYVLKLLFNKGIQSFDYIDFILSNEQPYLKLLAPTSDTTIAINNTDTAIINLKLEVFDSDGYISKLELFDNATKIKTITQDFENILLYLTKGAHNVYLKVYDDRNLSNQTAPICINIKNENDVKKNIITNAVFFPNPVKDKLWFDNYKINKMEIYDITGRNVKNNIKHYANVLDFSMVKTGIYLIYAIDNNGKVLITKIIKY